MLVLCFLLNTIVGPAWWIIVISHYLACLLTTQKSLCTVRLSNGRNLEAVHRSIGQLNLFEFSLHEIWLGNPVRSHTQLAYPTEPSKSDFLVYTRQFVMLISANIVLSCSVLLQQGIFPFTYRYSTARCWHRKFRFPKVGIVVLNYVRRLMRDSAGTRGTYRLPK